MLKKLLATSLIVFSLFISGCGLSTDELAEEVRENIIETLRDEDATRHVKVTDFTLIHLDGKKYRGVLTTRERGQKFVYSVDVTFDGKNFMWEIEE